MRVFDSYVGFLYEEYPISQMATYLSYKKGMRRAPGDAIWRVILRVIASCVLGGWSAYVFTFLNGFAVFLMSAAIGYWGLSDISRMIDTLYQMRIERELRLALGKPDIDRLDLMNSVESITKEAVVHVFSIGPFATSKRIK